MNNEYLIEEFKKDHIEHVLNYIKESGGIFPHLTVLADMKDPQNEDEEKPAIIHIPIPNEYMESGLRKQIFVDEVVPKIFDEIKSRFIGRAVVFTSEAWMRSSQKEDISDFEYEALPKKEILLITIDTEEGSEFLNYEIIREGKQVNSDGDFTDKVRLEKMESLNEMKALQGRFSNLFTKLKD
jgi:hypothetical protein